MFTCRRGDSGRAAGMEAGDPRCDEFLFLVDLD